MRVNAWTRCAVTWSAHKMNEYNLVLDIYAVRRFHQNSKNVCARDGFHIIMIYEYNIIILLRYPVYTYVSEVDTAVPGPGSYVSWAPHKRIETQTRHVDNRFYFSSKVGGKGIGHRWFMFAQYQLYTHACTYHTLIHVYGNDFLFRKGYSLQRYHFSPRPFPLESPAQRNRISTSYDCKFEKIWKNYSHVQLDISSECDCFSVSDISTRYKP